MSLLTRLQSALLRLAPRTFRERFGAELLDSARRALEQAGRRGPRAAWQVGLRHAADIALTGLRLRLRATDAGHTAFLLAVLGLAATIGWIDTHAEEVQPAAFLLLNSAAGLAFLAPRRAWLWWLLLGLSIPAAHLLARALGVGLPYPVSAFGWTFLALVPAGLGTLLGLFLRFLRGARPHGA